MRKKPNSKLIGLFIVCGITLFIATIGMFVADKIFGENRSMVVMYFSESIKGLDVGSPVMFKGVNIGKVHNIDLITGNEQEKEFTIPVYVIFNNKNFNPELSDETRRDILNDLVRRGLRARLNSLSYLTGQLMIELEMMPEGTPAVYRAKTKDIPEVPTVLSPFGELSQGFQEIPIKQIAEKADKFLDSLNNEIVPQLSGVLEGFSKIPQQTQSIPETLDSFNRTMKNISGAAKSLNNFADYIERHPESLLRGKGEY